MSRSFKKTSIISDEVNTSYKKKMHHKTRTKTRNMMANEDYDFLPDSKAHNLIDSYEIKDWYMLPNKYNESQNKFYNKGRRK